MHQHEHLPFSEVADTSSTEFEVCDSAKERPVTGFCSPRRRSSSSSASSAGLITALEVWEHTLVPATGFTGRIPLEPGSWPECAGAGGFNPLNTGSTLFSTPTEGSSTGVASWNDKSDWKWDADFLLLYSTQNKTLFFCCCFYLNKTGLQVKPLVQWQLLKRLS